MRDPKRIDKIIFKLRDFWYAHPDMRFWQLISYLKTFFEVEYEDYFYAEDDKTEAALDKAIGGK